MDRIKFRGHIPDKSPKYKELDSSLRTSGYGLPLLAMPSTLCTECITYFLVFFFLFELAMIWMLHHARISSVDCNSIEFHLGSWSSKNLEYHRHHNCHSRQSHRPSSIPTWPGSMFQNGKTKLPGPWQAENLSLIQSNRPSGAVKDPPWSERQAQFRHLHFPRRWVSQITGLFQAVWSDQHAIEAIHTPSYRKIFRRFPGSR